MVRGRYQRATASFQIRITPPIRPPRTRLSATTPTVPEMPKPIGIKKDLCRNDVCLVLRLRCHIIQHKLLQAMFFGKRTVQPVVTDLMGADNPLHLRTQILIKKDEAVPFDDAVHTLE